jgi:hypothetical protein
LPPKRLVGRKGIRRTEHANTRRSAGYVFPDAAFLAPGLTGCRVPKTALEGIGESRALSNLGHALGRGTIAEILALAQHGIEPTPEREWKTTWKEFLTQHWDLIVAADLEIAIDNRTRIHLPFGRTARTTLDRPGQNDRFFGLYAVPMSAALWFDPPRSPCSSSRRQQIEWCAKPSPNRVQS